jgi:hypothetical protein
MSGPASADSPPPREYARAAPTSRAGLREAEDIVDEEQHVLALVAEIFGDSQASEADADARARRLVHLPNTSAPGPDRGTIVLLRVLVDADSMNK